MRTKTIAVLLGVVLAAGCGGGDGGGGPSGPNPPPPPPGGGGNPVQSATVTAGAAANTFSPTRVDLLRNGTVTWTFGALAHNVTFSGSGAPPNIGDTTNNSVSRTFASAGTFEYTCTLHAGMNGSVVVQ